MDPRMNEYGGCQPSYQGYGMGQMMNGYDGYQSSSQYGGFGYDVQQDHCVNNQEAYANNQEAYHQGPYTNNQGPYHHQQWNNQEMYHQQQRNDNYQDHCSSSSHQEPSSSSQQEDYDTQVESLDRSDRREWLLARLARVNAQRKRDKGVLSVVDEMIESPKEEEIQPMVSSSSTSQATLRAHCDVTNQSHIHEMQLEENEKFLEGAKQLASPIDEECAKDDPNELTPKALDLPKVKESLQALLGSNNLGEFHSKVEHLRFILENKEVLGNLLQEVEEEQSSNLYMRTLFEEVPSGEKKEINGSKGVHHVEDVIETPEMVRHASTSVMKPKERLKPLKRRRRKPKGAKGRGIEPKPPLLTFTPLRLIDGKLECNVRSSKGIKPFARVKVLLRSSSQDKEGMISEKMARMFNMKLGDYGPRPPFDPPPSHH